HLFARVLRGAGIQVLEADSGAAALELVHNTPPDVIVTDIEMPGLSGIDLCRSFRHHASLKNSLIVVVSGAGTTQREEAVAAGCDVVLSKPCSPALLLATIQRLLIKP